LDLIEIAVKDCKDQITKTLTPKGLNVGEQISLKIYDFEPKINGKSNFGKYYEGKLDIDVKVKITARTLRFT